MKSRFITIGLGLLSCMGLLAQSEYKDITAPARQLADSLLQQANNDTTVLPSIECDTTGQEELPAIRYIRMLEQTDSLKLQQTIGEMPANPLFLPIIFEEQKNTPYQSLNSQEEESASSLNIPINDKWLQQEAYAQQLRDLAQNYVIVNNPELVRYNQDNLPEVPQQFVIVNDPVKQILTIQEKPLVITNDVGTEKVKIKHWIWGFQSAIQFSQVYVSDNWYQGGNSNLNLLSDQQFSIKYNDPDENRILFDNLIQWRLNLNSAPEDTLRSVRVSEDLFQINSKFGLKAINNWYYSATLNFKTQFLTSYAVNTNNKTASFLSPGELNLGLGISYQYKSDKKRFDTSLSFSPLSYNLQFVIDDDMDPTAFGIKNGKCNNLVGSSFEGRFKWEFVHNMVWTCRLFYFTNYERVQGDFENTIDFILNKFFSTKLFVHVRYDDSRALDPKFNHFQLKELLSFGFNYKF